MSNYFDLHCHPSFKSFLQDTHLRESCWHSFEFPVVGLFRKEELSSQSSLQQLVEGDVRIAVATIVPLEKGFSESTIFHWIRFLLPILSEERLELIKNSEYFDLLLDEHYHLLQSQEVESAPEQTYNLLNSFDEINPDKLNLILAIEGGFGLGKEGTNIVDNLLYLKRMPYKFLHISLIHMTVYDICNHAFGMRLGGQDLAFKPILYGISNTGLDLIRTAYTDNVTLGKRILIDIKHMSLVSRLQLYKFRIENGYEDIPIIASHVGLTGISYTSDIINSYILRDPIEQGDSVEVQYRRPAGFLVGTVQTYFNPWSINLYDEEIRIIVNSDGLIGINMDQRIVGVDEIKGEYFSKSEFEEVTNGNFQTIAADFTEEPFTGYGFDLAILDEAESKRIKLFHLYHLCNQILHAVAVGGPDTWKHICIGSDFDGMINPVNCFTNATQFSDLEAELIRHLPDMISAAETSNPTIQFGHIEIEQVVRGIMYENALDFLKKHF